MKQLMVTIVLSALTFGASARSVSDSKNILLRTNCHHASAMHMELKDDNVVFSGLSRAKSDIYIMDVQGNVELSATVNRKNNTVNISALPAGSHVIALKQGAAVKMFEYSSGVVVHATKK